MIQRDNTPIYKAYYGTQPIYNIIATEQSGGGGGIDFSAIGYTAEDTEAANQRIQQDIEYSTLLYLNWDESIANTYFKGDIQLVYCPNVDTSNVTDMEGMFQGCESLSFIPPLNSSNVTNMNTMFYDCYSLSEIPNLDTSNVTTMQSMFIRCHKLTTIPPLNTSNVTNMAGMFQWCKNLQSLPLLDCGNVIDIGQMFAYADMDLLTDLGGFKDLKIDWKDICGLTNCPSLTYESIINVLDNLYDFRGNGDESTTRTLKINSNTYALLSESDIAVATNKGWIISH